MLGGKIEGNKLIGETVTECARRGTIVQANTESLAKPHPSLSTAVEAVHVLVMSPDSNPVQSGIQGVDYAG